MRPKCFDCCQINAWSGQAYEYMTETLTCQLTCQSAIFPPTYPPAKTSPPSDTQLMLLKDTSDTLPRVVNRFRGSAVM